MFSLALYAVGGYLVYENWPAISAWFGSVASGVTPAATAPAGATYPNSPVPTSFSTMQTFVDSAGNQWQFSTQTNQWVIATPGHTPGSPSPGMVVATPAPAAPAPVAVVPASPGTLVPITPVSPPIRSVLAPTAPAQPTNPPRDQVPGPTYIFQQPVSPVSVHAVPVVISRGFTPVRANV
jgi:hypothetical protein